MSAALTTYFKAVGIGLDVLLNALTGGVKYQTLSCRIGLSIQAGGWAAHIPWTASLRAHCIASVHEEIV